MRKLLDLLFERFGYVRVRFDKGPPLTFSNRDLTHATISKTLRKYVQFNKQSLVTEEIITDLTTQVVNDLLGVQSESLREQLNHFHNELLGDRVLLYVLACGRAAYWEFEIKILAQHLDLDIFEASSSPKAAEFKGLETIISNLKAKMPSLELNFKNAKKIRDSLIHSNFYELKSVTGAPHNKAVRKSLEGGVFKIDVSGTTNNKPLSEIGPQDSQDVGIFGWFLDAASGELLNVATKYLNDRIREMDALIVLRAHLGKELFERLCNEGKFPENDEEIQIDESSKSVYEASITLVKNLLK